MSQPQQPAHICWIAAACIVTVFLLMLAEAISNHIGRAFILRAPTTDSVDIGSRLVDAPLLKVKPSSLNKDASNQSKGQYCPCGSYNDHIRNPMRWRCPASGLDGLPHLTHELEQER